MNDPDEPPPMSQGPETAATAPPRTAADICREFAPSARARRRLDDRISPGAFLAALIEAGLHADAIRLMAHALLNREAVWWACLCARAAAGPAAPPDQHRALGAAVRWVLEPGPARRREADAAGFGAARRTPARAAALAASCAAGGPAEDPGPLAAPAPAPPDRVRAARHVAGCVFRSIIAAKPAGFAAQSRQFLSLGLDVAYGTNRWE